MSLTKYKNNDGTYTSPKNGKVYKSEKALRAHLNFKRTDKAFNFTALSKVRCNCKFCNKDLPKTNLTHHENGCYLNPVNMVLCKTCNKPIKNFRTSKGTCSRSCANTHFKSGENNGNWKQDSYRSTCFQYHEKKCVVCNEQNIVAVHHLDEDHDNNDPANLIPLCPTHHQYWHSNFRNLIEPTVMQYVTQWKSNNGV